MLPALATLTQFQISDIEIHGKQLQIMKRRGKLSFKGIYVNFFGIAKRKAIAFLFLDLMI